MRRFPLFLPLLAALLAFATAAQALPGKNTAGRRTREVKEEREKAERAFRDSITPRMPSVAPSPNHVVGTIKRVNPQAGFAVGWLHSRYLVLGSEIFTRNARLETTATLTLGTARDNRAIGLKILSGRPEIGDEIVVFIPAETQGDTPPEPEGG